MTFYCLTPIDVADECSLMEAVDWVALQRLPRAGRGSVKNITPHPEDPDELRYSRGEYDYASHADQECCDYYYPMCECAKTGSPVPVLEDHPGELLCTPEDYEACIELADNDDDKEMLRDCLAWKNKLKKEREPGMSRVFLALREGKLDSWGVKLLAPDLIENTLRMSDENKMLSDIGFSQIPAAHWSYEDIKWRHGRALLSGDRYVRIYVNVDQLMKIFPPPAKTSTLTFDEIAGYYVLNDKTHDDTEVEIKTARVSNAGRLPKHDWGEIQAYIDKKLWTKDIPEKQDAFVQEIRDWCAQNAMSVPSRSSLKARLCGIYKIFRTSSD